MADYYQYHTSGWVNSPSSISLCGSRHRLHIETETKTPTAGKQIMVRRIRNPINWTRRIRNL
jgi:hypothetical protein